MYRGRIAPTPTGLLHAGHAATFLSAAERARSFDGALVLRIEDLDPVRCKAEFTRRAIEDLKWLGISWDEGPDLGGRFGPYEQRLRGELYREAWRLLRDADLIYPCSRSRKDLENAPHAPHSNEPVFPSEWRPESGAASAWDSPDGIHWRFRVPNGRRVSFVDGRCGEFSAVAGVDFGDFPVWRKDNVPAYELAVVVDDAAMEITEVVRGEDLLLSTCRQLLLYEALGMNPPQFFHTPLLVDAEGRRLAKRDNALSVCALRERQITAEEVREMIAHPNA